MQSYRRTVCADVEDAAAFRISISGFCCVTFSFGWQDPCAAGMESTRDRSAIVVGDPDRTPEGIAVALTSNPLPISDPETLGFLAHRLQRMISFLETTVAQQNLPGAAVLIARDGEIACRTVAGLQNVETGDPLQLDTIYRIASMTKPITLCWGDDTL
mgnify:FL=1